MIADWVAGSTICQLMPCVVIDKQLIEKYCNCGVIGDSLFQVCDVVRTWTFQCCDGFTFLLKRCGYQNCNTSARRLLDARRKIRRG